MSRYDQLCAEHEWNVPERYNIAADVCDKHPRDKPAMIWERFDGARRDVSWGELQDLSNQAANVLRDHGVERGERVAVVLPPTPETAAVFFGTWKTRRDPALDVGALRRRRDRATACATRSRACSSPTRPTRRASTRRWSTRSSSSTTACSTAPSTEFETADTAADDPAQLYYTSGTTGPGQGHRARPPLRARPRGVRLLPRGAGRRALPRHGRVGVGRRHLAAARPVAPRRAAGRPAAQGRLRPRPAAGLPQPPRGHQRLHDADGDARDDGHRRRRHALPAEVPPRLLGRRAAEPRGDPLVPRAVRAHRARLLRADRVLPARRQLPLHGGPRGLDGQADARAGTSRSSTRTSSRSPRASAARSACARARTRTTRSATGATRRPRRRPSAATGSTPRTPRRRTRTATSGTPGAPTT